MDLRTPLASGTILSFPGMECTIEFETGRGSNAIVYQGSYPDALSPLQKHTVLIKELFPLHPDGLIRRSDAGEIICDADGSETFALHRRSFEYGNTVHLRLLQSVPSETGANLNTFSYNHTLYTVLGYTGGRSLEKELLSAKPLTLRELAQRMLRLLDALEAFHQNGLLHLDIAPDNILLIGEGRKERLMLIDYNSVYDQNSLALSPDYYSVKPGYTAPEVRRGKMLTVGPPADLYSAAAVFFRCLTGCALTRFQISRPSAPDISDAPLLQGYPDTVRSMVQEILTRGLRTLPGERYPDVADMRRSFEELLNRIDGVGITHWALWETGRRLVRQTVRENPSFSHLLRVETLYPSTAVQEGRRMPISDCISALMSPGGRSALLTAPGGMGKTTALLRAAADQPERFSAAQPAVFYLSLYGWREGKHNTLCDQLLNRLKFTERFDDARHALRQLLSTPLSNGRPVLLLLLDGLNEATGNPQPLLQEIEELSKLPGIRLLVASRSRETLPLASIELAPLCAEDAQQALGRHGLPMPEDPEMQQLLATPLMLSIFIQSALNAQKQMMVQTGDELLQAYFDALLQKERNVLTEGSEDIWQTDAALSFVLPAISAELEKRHAPLSDKELLPVAEKCYRLFRSRLLLKAFPQWIGKTRAIYGDTENAEQWFGRIVQDLLWKKLGLLLRDEQGAYRISHQIIGDYLCRLSRSNDRRIWQRRRIRIGMAVGGLIIALAACLLGYRQYLQPYPQMLAESVMDYGAICYREAGSLYNAMYDLLEAADPSEMHVYQLALETYQETAQKAGTASALPLYVIRSEKWQGRVMPWSLRPFDEPRYEMLILHASERKEAYNQYINVLSYLMERPETFQRYGEEYLNRLRMLIEIDADLTAALYQISLEPHKTGPYADQSVLAQTYQQNLAATGRQREHLSQETDLSQLETWLINTQHDQQQAENDLRSCTAVAVYQNEKGNFK